MKLNEIHERNPLHGNPVKLSIHNGPDQLNPPQLNSAVGPSVVVPVADFDFDMHTEAA